MWEIYMMWRLIWMHCDVGNAHVLLKVVYVYNRYKIIVRKRKWSLNIIWMLSLWWMNEEMRYFYDKALCAMNKLWCCVMKYGWWNVYAKSELLIKYHMRLIYALWMSIISMRCVGVENCNYACAMNHINEWCKHMMWNETYRIWYIVILCVC